MAIENHITLEDRIETFDCDSVASTPFLTSSPTKTSTTKSTTFSVLSLFSGCGGMDLGFKAAFDFLGEHYGELPFEIIWANGIDEAACRTYKQNIGTHIHQGDIWEMIDNLPQEADV